MFTSIGTLIKTLPKRSKTPEAILALYVRRVFGQSLVKTCADLPDEILSAAHAKTFSRGVLTIEAPGLLCTELQMRSGGLIKEINGVLGKKAVAKLRFRVG